MDKQALIDMTKYFWQQKKDSQGTDFWDLYLVKAQTERGDQQKEKSLLEYEMEYAGQQACLPAYHDNTTLVILVGESLEPLFQSIWAHNPRRLIPVVNEWYPPAKGSNGPIQGIVHWEYIRDLIEKMLQKPARNDNWQLTPLPQVKNRVPPNKSHIFKSVKDDPKTIFTYLQNQLRDDLLNPDCRVVVDITGAKKTMVAGAYMLAAYSDARICYVDTEGHHDDKKGPFHGRPYGFACHFRDVTNPVKELSLQNWDKLGELYDQYNFANALNLLPDATDKAYAEFPEVTNLRHFLHMCHYWEIGRLALAWEEAQKLPEQLQPYVPLAVKELHACWPQPESAEKTDTLFNQTRNVVIYVYDELHRVERLRSNQETYRDAFSRAYAVYETLFKARLVRLFIEKELDVRSLKPNLSSEGEDWELIVTKLLRKMQSFKARQVLQGEARTTEYDSFKIEVQWERREGTSPYLVANVNPGDLAQKRNDVTHSYVPVIAGDVDDAVKLACLNFEDYLCYWVDWPDKVPQKEMLKKKENYQVPDWERLKEICNLHFIPVESQDNQGDAHE